MSRSLWKMALPSDVRETRKVEITPVLYVLCKGECPSSLFLSINVKGGNQGCKILVSVL